MVDYIRQLSGPEIFRASYSIYLSNWRAMAVIYFLPVLPVLALVSLFQAQESVGITYLLVFLLFLASTMTTTALTIAIGDLCLQRPLSVARSWRVALSRGFGRLLGTQLLVFLLIMLWMVLLIIPGLIAAMRFIFSLSVVALENQAGMPALRRSRELARGKLWRNFGVLLLVMLPQYLVMIILMIIIGAATALLISGSGSFAFGLIVFIGNILPELVFPPFFVAIVLLYYDMRARKEAFDSTALAQELMH
jgi:hypothetical protein